MKAYTVYQPYAYATIAGLKHYETRPRRTNIRGRVAVHAGKKRFNADGISELLSREIAYGKILETEHERGFENLKRATELAYGAVIGTVEIVDCVPVEEIADTLTVRERALGDYSPGRFAWVLENPVMFDKPIPASGKQGWWNWEEPKNIKSQFTDKLSCIAPEEIRENESIFGNFYFGVTVEQLEELKAGRILFSGEEYGIFIALMGGSGKEDNLK